MPPNEISFANALETADNRLQAANKARGVIYLITAINQIGNKTVHEYYLASKLNIAHTAIFQADCMQLTDKQQQEITKTPTWVTVDSWGSESFYLERMIPWDKVLKVENLSKRK